MGASLKLDDAHVNRSTYWVEDEHDCERAHER